LTGGSSPQGYGENFARIYNLRWGGFASGIAPVIRTYYESLPIARSNRRILDVACGTGQLLASFLSSGYTGTGLDASPHMLLFARRNAGAGAEEGRADFVCVDAADFRLAPRYGLAVSTFDALNHLSSRRELASCFACVRASLAEGGRFIFDLNTARGLRMWNSMSVEETDELFILNRGIFEEGMERAYARITGFLRTEGGRYERFEQTAYNTVFRMTEVAEDLRAAGFAGHYFCSPKDLSLPVAEPEELARTFVVARNGP
jgi:SAM-dependent methyltransferase